MLFFLFEIFARIRTHVQLERILFKIKLVLSTLSVKIEVKIGFNFYSMLCFAIVYFACSSARLRRLLSNGLFELSNVLMCI